MAIGPKWSSASSRRPSRASCIAAGIRRPKSNGATFGLLSYPGIANLGDPMQSLAAELELRARAFVRR
ncbi:hypothetical protein [Novosphingobium aquae]|uniref:Uncharacterized protein n=1 Tax=Novosphingobium aquae TaxID=3133435 RepID=A0ABU8SCF6_9SPHN